jgi:protoporphyrinogen oxidase
MNGWQGAPRPSVNGWHDPALVRGFEEPIDTAILGGGPAGLTAAHVLALRGKPAAVFEADDMVGGIARTVEYNGFRFDIGGHRFFTKLAPIQALWEQVLGEELLTRPRLSHIYYDGQYLSYPLKSSDVVSRLGVWESTLCALSYIANLPRRRRTPETFEEWVTSRFGKRLYDTFFRSYTEKVWGIPGSEIRAQWAAQRIKDFSLFMAVLSILGLRRREVTTLIDEFSYPRLGPGQMWEAFRERVQAHGIPVHLNHRCLALHRSGNRVERIVVGSGGARTEHRVGGVISSIPLSELVLSMSPAPPPDVVAAATGLRYRSLCLVALITTEPEPFPDNWIYLHDPGTRAGRVQNFGAWSDGLVVPGMTCLGAEYFCFEGDDIWTMPEANAVKLATDELARIGLIDPSKVVDGCRVHVPRAYPVYDWGYEERVAVLREFVEGIENLETCGRNGLHRYNNQDHSMWTAILAALNLIDGASHDVWSVNTEAEYHEEGEMVEALLDIEAPGPAVPAAGSEWRGRPLPAPAAES